MQLLRWFYQCSKLFIDFQMLSQFCSFKIYPFFFVDGIKLLVFCCQTLHVYYLLLHNKLPKAHLQFLWIRNWVQLNWVLSIGLSQDSINVLAVMYSHLKAQPRKISFRALLDCWQYLSFCRCTTEDPCCLLAVVWRLLLLSVGSFTSLPCGPPNMANSSQTTGKHH